MQKQNLERRINYRVRELGNEFTFIEVTNSEGILTQNIIIVPKTHRLLSQIDNIDDPKNSYLKIKKLCQEKK
jgi:hypothetical protein